MIQFLCPGCQQSFTVDNSRANSIGTCPKCSSRFYVPESPDAPAPPPPLPVRKSPKPVEPVTLKRHRYEDDEPRRNSRQRTEDWDDDDEEDDEPIRKTKRRSKKKKPLSFFDAGNSFSVFLLGYVGLSILLMMLSFAVPSAVFVPMVLGWLVASCAGLWFTILTFQDSIEAGLLCLFVPFYGLFYLISNFDYVKKSFYLSLVSMLMMLMSLLVMAKHFNLAR